MPNIDEIREMLKNMTEEQRLELIMLCSIENNKSQEASVLLRFANNYKCPFCGSNHVVKNGARGKQQNQKFICRNCKKNYSIRTNTIFYHTKKNIKLWQEYIELFSQGLSLAKIVDKMEHQISIPTAFQWRHKILKVLSDKNDNSTLGGIIEADETYFEESQKGSRHITRKPRKRGVGLKNDPISSQKEHHLVGLSHHKVCVLTAIDRNKNSFGRPVGYGKVNKNEIEILQHHIQKDSILITDGDKSYQVLNNVKLKQLKFGLVDNKNKIYHMNNINNYHSRLKKFMQRFNGVATKYLDLYVDYFKEIKANIDIFADLLQTSYYCRASDIRTKRICFENVFTSGKMF